MLLKSPLIIIIDWAGLSAACLTPTVLGQSWPLCFISSLCTCALYFLTRKLASGGMKLSYGTTKLTKVLRSMKTQQEGKYKERFVWLTCWLSSTNCMHCRASLTRYRYRACTRVPMIWFSKKPKNCLQPALGQEWSNHWRTGAALLHPPVIFAMFIERRIVENSEPRFRNAEG